MRIGLAIFILVFWSVYSCAQVTTDSTNVEAHVSKHYSVLKKAIVPSALLIYGAISLESSELRQLDRYINGSTLGDHSYSGSIDDYLRYGAVAAVYGLDLVGVKSKSNFIDRTAMLLISISLTSTVVTLTKNGVYRARPDVSGFSSFPSSHTAMAFMSAEFMHQEYKDRSPWFTVIGYTMAATTGVLRLYHHVHWLSDVAMGAGYGIAATKIAYFVYPYLRKLVTKNKNSRMVLLPSFQNGIVSVGLSGRF